MPVSKEIINLSDLSFIYPDGAAILQNFNWRVERGEVGLEQGFLAELISMHTGIMGRYEYASEAIKLAGVPDEGLALTVLVGARTFTDEHDLRILRAGARNRVLT